MDEVSFEVSEGSVVCLLGRNGAGKTTTVECAEGFRQPDAGSVRVFGADPRTQRDLVVGRIGVMLQEGGGYQAATAREMLRLYAALYTRPRDVEEVLALVDLEQRAEDRFRTLSGGEKQRLNLALALISRADLYFLDEPTAGMDAAARRRTWDVVASLRAEGAAIVLSTHFIDEAERLADRVAILAAGRLVAFDTVASVAGSGGGLTVTTPAPINTAELSAAVGAHVAPAGQCRYAVEAGADHIAAVTQWFAERDLPLEGVNITRGSLEEAFLRLTGEPADAS